MAPADSAYVGRQVDAVVAFAGLRPHMRILEVGCGMGRYTLPLVRRDFNVAGLDISPALLERLREQDGGARVITHCASVFDHPSELDSAFDAVIGFFILHHLEDLVDQLRSIRRMLRPGSRVCFLEPNPYNLLYYAQITLSPNMRWWAEKGIFQMRRRVVLAAMIKADFVRPAHRTFGFLPPMLMNQRFGPRLETTLERVPIWRRALPFQLFRADLA